MPGLAGTVSVYNVPAVIAALLLANVPGSGTVSASAGTATFSTSQAGVIQNGSVITVAGVQYTVSAFNGTTSCTLSGAPTFAAASFVIRHRAVQRRKRRSDAAVGKRQPVGVVRLRHHGRGAHMKTADADVLAKMKAVHRAGGVRIGDNTGQLPASTALQRFDAALRATIAKVGPGKVPDGFLAKAAAARRRLGKRS
jgi:hypothetical protein